MSPATGLLTAVSQLSANYGNEFQALNAEGSLFHA
jgi:hypothetical protein